MFELCGTDLEPGCDEQHNPKIGMTSPLCSYTTTLVARTRQRPRFSTVLVMNSAAPFAPPSRICERTSPHQLHKVRSRTQTRSCSTNPELDRATVTADAVIAVDRFTEQVLS